MVAKKPQKVSPAMKDLIKARKSDSPVLGDIQQFLVSRSIQEDENREKHKIHVSEITKKDWCPRQAYYKVSETPVSDHAISTPYRVQMFWEYGNDGHARWQDWLHSMNRLYGLWYCKACENTWWSTAPKECPICNCPWPEYREVPFEDPELPLVGHADGVDDETNSILEFKGIGKGTIRIEEPDLFKKHQIRYEKRYITDIDAMWKEIRRPFKSHLLQVNFYGWMAKRNGINYDQAVLLYEFKSNQDTKEFTVPFSERLIEPYIEKLEGVVTSVKSGTAPPRPPLFDKDSAPCKDCGFKTTCYGGGINSSEEKDSGISVSGALNESRKPGDGARADTSRRSDKAVSTDSGRPYRLARRRTDAAVHPSDTARGVPGDATSNSGGG